MSFPLKLALWALVGFYAVSRALQVFQGGVPIVAIVSLHVLPAALFAWVHGVLVYQSTGMAVFFAVCLTVGNIFGNVGVHTGFPFGHYYFTDLMGPKIMAVPILLGLAYVGMSYLSWTLARLILGRTSLITLPLSAAFIMTAWDFSTDPVWSTILHAWIWQKGGAYFGVPISNFFGWYLTVYCFYQTFALYLRSRPPAVSHMTRDYWRIPVIFYAVSAAGNLLLAIPRIGPAFVTDPAGAVWRVSDITGASVLVSIFTMGAFAFMAWARVSNRRN